MTDQLRRLTLSEMRWLLWTLVVMATMTSRDTGVFGTVQYRPGVSLLHLTADNSTGFIYVGAVDHIYQLSPDRLEPVSVAVTGNPPARRRHLGNFSTKTPQIL